MELRRLNGDFEKYLLKLMKDGECLKDKNFVQKCLNNLTSDDKLLTIYNYTDINDVDRLLHIRKLFIGENISEYTSSEFIEQIISLNHKYFNIDVLDLGSISELFSEFDFKR